MKTFIFTFELSHWRWHHVEPCAEIKIEKIARTQDSMSKTNFFFGILTFNPLAMWAMWLYVGACQEYRKNEFRTRLNKNSPWAPTKYAVGIWHAWGCQKVWEISSSSILKKKLMKYKFSSRRVTKKTTSF
jgi:hypothetical protein